MFPVGTDLSSVLAEQDYIREILHFARYLLAKFIAENPPVLIHKDLTVEGDLTVKGKTVVGHTIVDGSLKVAEGLKAASISSKTSHFETAGIHQASIDDASIDHARIVDLSTKGIVSLELSAESAHINHFQGQTMKVDDLYADNLSVREIGVDDIAMKQARAEVLDAGSIYVDHSIRAQRAEFAGLGAKAASFSQLAAAKAEITNGMVLGYDAKVAEHSSSAALGSGSEVSGHNSFAIGTDHHLTENHSIAIGSGLKKLEADSVVIGFDKPGLAVVKATGANLDDSILLSLRKRLERIDRTINRYQAYANNPRYRRWSSYYRSMVERFEQQKQGYLARYDARLQELHLDASSRVGIGTTQPEQSLHISGAMKLEPMDHAPADPSLGTIYMSSDNAVCVYMADGWEVMAGDGECFSYQTTGVGRRGNRSGRGGTARR